MHHGRLPTLCRRDPCPCDSLTPCMVRSWSQLRPYLFTSEQAPPLSRPLVYQPQGPCVSGSPYAPHLPQGNCTGCISDLGWPYPQLPHIHPYLGMKILLLVSVPIILPAERISQLSFTSQLQMISLKSACFTSVLALGAGANSSSGPIAVDMGAI